METYALKARSPVVVCCYGMSTGLKVLGVCLAGFGMIMVGLMLLGFLNWIIIGFAVVGLVYLVFRLKSPKPKALYPGDRDLHKRLKDLERDVDSLTRR